MHHASTNALERAVQQEGTVLGERSDHSESTKTPVRAVAAESAIQVERAMRSEGTNQWESEP